MTTNLKERDITEKISGALLQHGPLSNRIYLMKLNQADPKQLIGAMGELAKNNGYTKIFAKIPANQAEIFIDSGYQQEAVVPAFFHAQEACAFLGYYLDPDRKHEESLLDLENIVEMAKKKGSNNIAPAVLPAGAVLRRCVPEDAASMSKLFGKVFSSYPFPIDKPDFITNTMLENVAYFGIEINKKFVSLSSAQMDTVSKNAEMTDFATLPEFRGNSFASLLLSFMEKEMRPCGIQTAYTIARAISPAMNITFGKAGYKYGGRLINNTNIAGQIESMNVWYKQFI
ncbi:MAG: putative beta-lysine N-acetyltransferase [Phycisphaerae bacterium]|nr:putative beta-lysine N-acetyltransferase [Phycisphaerae bacterium]